jgi:hypothetical protein
MRAEEVRALARGVRALAAGVRGMAALEAAGAGPKTAGSAARRAEALAERMEARRREGGEGDRGKRPPRFTQAELRAMFEGRKTVPRGYEVVRRERFGLASARG